MRCPTCNSVMVALFYSHVCDRCDPPAGASAPMDAEKRMKQFQVGDLVRLVNVVDISIPSKLEGSLARITSGKGRDFYLQTPESYPDRWWAPPDNLEPVERKASFAVGDRVWLPNPSLDKIPFPEGSIGTVHAVQNYGYDVILDADSSQIPWAVGPTHLEELS